LPFLLEGIGDFGWHVVFVMFGQHFAGLEHPGGIELADRNDALAFTTGSVAGPSVTEKWTVRLSGSRLTDPATTNPPTRNG
jgi:hypothetical protein